MPIRLFGLSLLCGITSVNAQMTRVRFFCSKDNSDSIACHIIITDKNNHRIESSGRVYSYPINLVECQKITCYPDEPAVFYRAESDCVQTGPIILIDILSIDAYMAYKRRHEKNAAMRNKGNDIQIAPRLGQNDGVIEKSISF